VRAILLTGVCVARLGPLIRSIFAGTLLLTGVCIVPASAGNQILLRNVSPADGIPQILAADRSGHIFVISTLQSVTGQFSSRVLELDLAGSRLASMDIAQIGLPRAAATDGQGDLIIAGQSVSPAGIVSDGIVLKVDPKLRNTLFVRLLPATIGAVTADASGNVYVTGSTSDASFPVTTDAYQTKPPRNDTFGTASYAFLSEISPSGDQLLYSTYFGDDATYCIGGSACLGAFGRTAGTAIAVDAAGAVVIGGNTTASSLPTTAGALATTCSCSYRNSAGFVARFQPGGVQQLRWSTFLTTSNLPPPYQDSFALSGLAIDPAGNVIVGGSGPNGLPATPGALQPSLETNANAGFLAKLNNTGTAAIWGTYFGGNRVTRVSALRVDAQGRVLFSGLTLNAFQPTDGSSSSLPYVTRLANDGATLVDYYEGPVGQDLAITSAGGFAALGESLWIETANPGPSLLGMTNSAGGGYSSTIVRSELVTLYGIGIGPATPINGQVQNGAFTSSLGGYQVLVDEVAAPLLYADSTQMNIVVPRGIGAAAHIQIVTPAGTVDGPILSVPYSAVPAVFHDRQTGLVSALNQDGSINSPSNPAKPGSVVTVFVSGGGANDFADGAMVPMGIYNALTTVWAGNSRSFEVVFAGDAPGWVAGIMQINLRLPDSLPPGGTLAFTVMIGGVSTGQNQIAVTR
jgi:uncharacterized protein (TIGR03437 family)